MGKRLRGLGHLEFGPRGGDNQIAFEDDAERQTHRIPPRAATALRLALAGYGNACPYDSLARRLGLRTAY